MYRNICPEKTFVALFITSGLYVCYFTSVQMWVIAAENPAGAHRAFSATLIYTNRSFVEFGRVRISSWLPHVPETFAKVIAAVCIKLFDVFSDSLIAEMRSKNRNNRLFLSSVISVPLPSH